MDDKVSNGFDEYKMHYRNVIKVHTNGIFGSEVFCAWVYGCVVTDVLSEVEGDWNVNRGRVLL